MSERSFNLDGHTVIITGGAGLLGKEYAVKLAKAGASVVVADRDGPGARETAERVPGGTACSLELDVTDPLSVQAAVKETVRRFGRIDGLVNNAALDPKFDAEHSGRHSTAFEDYPLDSWNRELNVNITGMFLCTQAAGIRMLEQGKGSIVNISSTYGLVAPDQRLYEREENAVPDYKPVTYSVTKSAVSGLTKYLAAYWGGKGIRVNTLSPGGVYNNHDEEFVRRYSLRTPLGRMARPEELSGALIFLLSDASSYMTGANLIVDGGWTAW